MPDGLSLDSMRNSLGKVNSAEKSDLDGECSCDIGVRRGGFADHILMDRMLLASRPGRKPAAWTVGVT
jgi:hypothetical protein